MLDAVLMEEGVDRGQLATLDFRDGVRAAVAFPEEVAVGEPEADDANPGRSSLAVSFRLGPGSYATMLMKRCTFDL